MRSPQAGGAIAGGAEQVAAMVAPAHGCDVAVMSTGVHMHAPAGAHRPSLFHTLPIEGMHRDRLWPSSVPECHGADAAPTPPEGPKQSPKFTIRVSLHTYPSAGCPRNLRSLRPCMHRVFI